MYEKVGLIIIESGKRGPLIKVTDAFGIWIEITSVSIERWENKHPSLVKD